MRNVVTLSRPLDIRVHGGPRDFKVPMLGGAIYCLAGTTLPAEPEPRAREMLRRLAYGFNDYAAREVAARYHRDRKREILHSESDEQGDRGTVRIDRHGSAQRVENYLRSDKGRRRFKDEGIQARYLLLSHHRRARAKGPLASLLLPLRNLTLVHLRSRR
jgi:hypothetical protein